MIRHFTVAAAVCLLLPLSSISALSAHRPIMHPQCTAENREALIQALRDHTEQELIDLARAAGMTEADIAAAKRCIKSN
jgi:hypothetical protein